MFARKNIIFLVLLALFFTIAIVFAVDPINWQYVAPTSSNDFYTNSSVVFVNVTSNYSINGSVSRLEWINESGTHFNISVKVVNWTQDPVLERNYSYGNMSGMKSGVHYYFMWIQPNETGAWQNTTVRNITVDVTIPYLTVESPLNRTYNINRTDLNFTYGDANLVDRCWWYNATTPDGGPVFINTQSKGACNNITGGVIFNTTKLTNNITVVVNDSVGNVNVTTIFFTVDVNVPVINLSSPVNGTTYYSRNITLNASLTDNGAFDKCWHVLNGNTTFAVRSCVDYNFTFLAEAYLTNQNITFYANDSAGNVNSSFVSFTVQTVDVINLSSPANNSWSNKTNETLQFVYYYNGSAPTATCKLVINGTLNSGTNLTVPRNTNVHIYSNSPLRETSINWSIICNGSTTANVTSYNFTIRVDNSLPVINLSSPVNGTTYYSRNITLNASLTDNGAFDTCWHVLNGNTTFATRSCTDFNFTFVAEAYLTNQNITFYANDSAGNINSSFVAFTVQTVDAVNLVSPANNSWSNRTNETIQFVYYYNGSAPTATCKLVINGTLDSGTNLTVARNTNVHMYSTYSLDERNTTGINWTVICNGSATANVSAQNFTAKVDRTAPTMTINFPVNNSVHDSRNITLNVTYLDSGAFDNCWYVLNGNSSVNLTCPNATITILAEASKIRQNITFYVNDSAGNVKSDMANLSLSIVDSVNLFSPSTSAWLNGTNNSIVFIYNYTGAAAYANCTLIINGTQESGLNGSALVLNNSKTHIRSNYSLPEGQINWSIACSANGTIITSQNYTLGIDHTVPSASLTLSTAAVTVGSPVTMTCSSSDAGSGISTAILTVTNPVGSNDTTKSCGQAYTTTIAGIYTVIYTATDSVGKYYQTSQTFTASSGGSTTGGGGGGGSAVSKKAVYSYDVMNHGVVTKITLIDPEIGLKQMTIEVNNKANKVTITISKYSGQPAVVTHNITGGKVYQYLEIGHDNLNDSNIASSKLRFNVTKSWLAANGYGANDVILQRYSNGTWTKLATTMLGESASDVEYEANSPGLSIFAITAEKAAAPSAAVCGNGAIESGEQCDGSALGGQTCTSITGGFTGGILSCKSDCTFNTLACTSAPAGSESVCGNAICETGETPENCAADCASQQEAPAIPYWVYITIVVVIIVVVLGYIYYYKWK